MSNILYNAIRTPDGTILESLHGWDYNIHNDANGKIYGIDGGLNYLRRIGDWHDCDELSILYDSSTHEKIREVFKWGSRGKDGNGPIKYQILKEMETEHIQKILETQKHICDTVVELVFKDELKYRKVNSII